MVTKEETPRDSGSVERPGHKAEVLEPEREERQDVLSELTDLESRTLRSRAAEIIKALEDSEGSAQMEIISSVASVGVQTQRTAASELELLRTRVGDVLTGDGPGAKVSKDLVDLRLALNQINPHAVGRQGVVRRVFGMFPLVGRSLPAMKVVEKIAVRYEPVARQVDVIETRLREGQSMLVRDSVELKKLYEQVEAQQLPVQKNARFGELLIQELDDLLGRTEDTLKCEKVRNLLHDVATRVQDLRTMEEVNIQFFVSIEMTRQNNQRLAQSVERTLALGTNVVMVGLAIQTALARQRRVLEATRRTREFLGDLIVANAEAIKQHTSDIGDVYNDPVIALDKIAQAHNDLIESMNISDRLKQEGIKSARDNIAKLTELSREMTERSRGVREQAAEADSVEA